MKVYQELASKLAAIDNCQRTNNQEWIAKHKETLENIMDSAPSGAGIDCGTRLMDESTPEKLQFFVEFHHMNDGGMYDGWTQHVVTVKPSLVHGITLTISGRDRNGIKEYLGDVYHHWLTDEWDREAGNTVNMLKAVAAYKASQEAEQKQKEG